MVQGRGLVTQHISKQLERWCEAAHSEFLASHSLDYWRLTVIGLLAPVILVTSETPGGDLRGPNEIEVTPNFQVDLRSLLDAHYVEHSVTEGGKDAS